MTMKVIQGVASNKEELIEQISKVLEELSDVGEDDTSCYAFPEIVTDNTTVTQLTKVFEELSELAVAVNCRGTMYDILIEAWDVIHATETLMRIVADDADVIEAHRKVYEKNKKRGYYEER